MENGTSTDLKWIRSKKRRDLAESVLEIMDNFKAYYPLTVRQVYYQCVSKLLIQNNQNEYKKISVLLTDLRREDVLSWDYIEDRTRRTTEKSGVSDIKAWADDSLIGFMDYKYYTRCKIQTQSVYVEVCTEKDALSTILEKTVIPFCTRLNIVRGHPSSTLIEKMSRRFGDAIMKGLKPILIHLGDFDPSGIAIPKIIIRSLSKHHSVDVHLIRAGLNHSQIEEYNLPIDGVSGKKEDPNFKAWAAEYGESTSPVELDALHPQILIDITENALESAYDMGLIAEQEKIEEREDARLREVRHGVLDYLKQNFPDVFQQSCNL